MTRRLPLAITVGLVLAASCASPGPGTGNVRSPSPIPHGPLVLTFTAGDEASATARTGDQTRRAFVESHCWTTATGDDTSMTRCVDTVMLTARDLAPKLLTVARGTELRIEGTAERVRCTLGPARSLYRNMARLEIVDGAAVLDRHPGMYALRCLAVWPQGDVPFVLAVEIAPDTGRPRSTPDGTE